MTISPRAIKAALRKYITGDHDTAEQAMRSALTAALAVDGLCLVPKEPTMAMLYAGERAWIDDPLKRSSTLYRAMIAAATTVDSQREDNKK